MRWAIKRVDGPYQGLLPGRHEDRAEALERLRVVRAHGLGAGGAGTWRLVRIVTRSERLQRELDRTRQERDARDALCRAFERERRRVAAQVVRATSEERQRIVEALIRCSREDLPPEVCALARERGLSLDGLGAIDRRIEARVHAAIFARWVQRGCP